MADKPKPPPSQISPLIALHALAMSRHPISGAFCEDCDTPLHWLVVGWCGRGWPQSVERLRYCTSCDDIADGDGPWPSGPST